MTRIFGFLSVLLAGLDCFACANNVDAEHNYKNAAIGAATENVFSFVSLDFMHDFLSLF